MKLSKQLILELPINNILIFQIRASQQGFSKKTTQTHALFNLEKLAISLNVEVVVLAQETQDPS